MFMQKFVKLSATVQELHGQHTEQADNQTARQTRKRNCLTPNTTM